MKLNKTLKMCLCSLSAMFGVLFAWNIFTPAHIAQAAVPEVSAPEVSNPETVVSPSAVFAIDPATGLITGYSGTESTVVIPPTIDGTTVTGLSGTFKDNETVETVVIPNTLTALLDYTFFDCKNLRSIAYYDISNPSEWLQNEYGQATITDKISTIGLRAFGGKTGISKFFVTEGNNIFSTTEDGVCLLSDVYENDVFLGTNLVRFASGYTCNTGYTLPDGLYSVGSYAFEDIHNDGHLTFPASIQVISDYGFYRYGMVDNNFIFPEECALHTIGSYGFSENRKLQIKFPKNLKTIGSYVCANNQNVAVDISETQIDTIPEYAFSNCSALHQITMPATLKHILAYAFSDCNNLSTVDFIGSELLTLGTGVFKNSPTLHYITIPEGVSAIENDTFNGCGNLGEVVLPDSVTTIGDNAFKDCVTIHTLVIPPNVTYISNTSFSGVNTTHIDTSKNKYAKELLGQLTLPSKGTVVTVGTLKYKITKITKTTGTVSVVGTRSKGKEVLSIPATVKINDGNFKVTSIEKNAFSNHNTLKKITIGKNIESIGKQAFFNCKNLKNITVKSKVIKTVKNNAFKKIHKNAKITLPKMSKNKTKIYKKKFDC